MNKLKLNKIVFCAVMLSYAFLGNSVSIANPVYEVESSGKNETSAVEMSLKDILKETYKQAEAKGKISEESKAFYDFIKKYL
ncbi:hypothetical protein [Succinivibrio dextrinosolvens]|uniref:hypothetical protein n=1 Tax=Succinivibrio dextrinosolvens TaxID=83771 RepID=UPI000945B7FB|nr:hypothetical protein [Succinivibrio dextrinosolvens]